MVLTVCPYIKDLPDHFTRGWLIDHHPGDQVHIRSQVVSSDRRKSGPRPIFYPPPLSALCWTQSHSKLRTLCCFHHSLCLTGLFQTSFSFPISSPNTLSQNIMLNHETLTRYKSSFLLLSHSNRPSTLSFVLFIFTTTTTPPSHILFSCSPPYTNTSLINCGTGNYTEPTGKFHFHLHLDCRIFHSYQSAEQDQCVAGWARMQTQLFMAFLYSYCHLSMDTHTHTHQQAWSESTYVHAQLYTNRANTC